MAQPLEFDSTLTRRIYARGIIRSALRRFDFWFFTALGLGFLVFGLFQRSSFALIFGTAYLAVSLLYYARWLLWQLFSPRHNRWFVKRHFSFDDEQILVEYSASEQRIKWSAVNEWWKYDDCYVIRLSDDGQWIIPKSDVPRNEIENLENMLDSKIDKIVTTKRKATKTNRF